MIDAAAVLPPPRTEGRHQPVAIVGDRLTMQMTGSTSQPAVNRKLLIEALGQTPRSLSDLAGQFGVPRKEIDEALPHIVRSARAAGLRLVIVPARCRACDFTFDASRLSRPSRCPACRSTSVHEPLIGRM